MEPEPPRVPKLGHKKSLFGCARCRSRRVKCNEAKPVCHNCERHGLPCVYDRNGFTRGSHLNVEAPRSSRSSSRRTTRSQTNSQMMGSQADSQAGADPARLPPGAEDGDEPPESRVRRRLELRLMQQYMSETGDSLTIDNTVVRRTYADVVPRLCFQSDALLYAMYALAAVHLVRKGGDDISEYDAAAARYFTLAISQHQKEVSQVSRETADHVVLTGCLVRIYLHIELRDRSREPYVPPWAWFAWNKASASTFATAWRLIGDDSSSLSMSLMNNTRHFNSFGKLVPRLKPRRLEHLLKRDDEDTATEPWGPLIQEGYENMIDFLSDVLDLLDEQGIQSDAHRRLFVYPLLVHQQYIERLREARPRALVMLAYYFALWSGYRTVWWIDDVSTREVHAIATVLQGKWKDYMDEPLRLLERTDEGR
ncbi:hypothetical protein GGR56DRAFT_569521 [Xylariaceae sp. FL0804]|nr:hypothetical protein GGR56DRAFT_569521 [Xylariaceae sp. FL0804]